MLQQFFTALTGHMPFLWQRRLFRQLLGSEPPKSVDIPTGLGKTAVMALWLIALAKGANLPRRLAYVVDRRAVVDQATRFAERLRSRMPDPLADALGIEQGSAGLPISTLRGGLADNREWMEDPSKPAIVVGTIDMVGSRLLFQGYGISPRMRPYQAGLLGADTLVLLDEAHLCPPFEALLRQIAEHRDGKLGPAAHADDVTPPFRLMSLSATGRDQTDMPPASVFKLDPEDHDEPVVRQRLTAQKLLRFTELAASDKLADRIASRAVELGASEHPARVLVYCNSRRDAVRVKTKIDKECRPRPGPTTGHESELLVGERRIYERTSLEEWLVKRGFLGGENRAPDVPTFLVATSAGEVGVDLNADHMVCDLVSWERMVQRLGRVNRRGGKHRSAVVDVLAVRPQAKASAGRAVRVRSEAELKVFDARLEPLRRLPRVPDGRYDASPAALADLRREHVDTVHAATTRVPLHPELTRPLLDAWSMTSLNRHEGRPEVSPWLRGWEEQEPQTSIVWRKHLPHLQSSSGASANPKMTTEFFRVAPIHITERLEVRSGIALDWLLKRAKRLGQRGEDNELFVDRTDLVALLLDRAGQHVTSAKLSELRLLAEPPNRLSKRDKRRKKEWSNRLLPGATLVVDLRVCGLRDGMLDDSWAPRFIRLPGDFGRN